jgi:predicted methyltransferase
MLNHSSKIFLLATAVLLSACAENNQSPAVTDDAKPAAAEPMVVEVAAATPRSLDEILAAGDEKAKARYQSRHPKETLEFIGIEPGMKVIEALPGGGWYSKILLPYLGTEGELVGVDYAVDMWQYFGGFATAEFIEKKKSWVSTWTADAMTWRDEESANVSAYQYGSQPESLKGTADAVLFIRALHNLARFEDKGAYLTNAIQESYDALKPGGVLGVVQHSAIEDRPDEWANGSNGYLKQSMLIEKLTAQGFEFVAASDINANPKDLANEGDFVWRLPPSLSGSDGDADKQAAMQAIGESNRMTLKFRKPI